MTWEAIQRIELCDSTERIWEILRDATAKLGCDDLRVDCRRDGRPVLDREVHPARPASARSGVSGPTATFRLSSGRDLVLVVSLGQAEGSILEADIAFRFLQRLSLASAERLDRLFAGPGVAEATEARAVEGGRPPAPATIEASPTPAGLVALDLAALEHGRVRPWAGSGWSLGWSAAPVPPVRPLGEE